MTTMSQPDQLLKHAGELLEIANNREDVVRAVNTIIESKDLQYGVVRYVQFLHKLIMISVRLDANLQDDQWRELFKTVMESLPSKLASDVFLAFTTSVKSTPIGETKIIIALLDWFIYGNNLEQMLSHLASKLSYGNSGQKIQMIIDSPTQQMIGVLVSLPDRLAKVLVDIESPHCTQFRAENYVPRVVQVVLRLGEVTKSGGQGGVIVAGAVIGRLSLGGYGKECMRQTRLAVTKRSDTDKIWVAKIISCLPDQSVDTVMDCLLKIYTEDGASSVNQQADWLDNLIGPCIATNQRVRRFLTNKCLLLKVYCISAVVSVMRLLAKRLPNHMVDLIANLANVWGDVNALRHTEYRQHRYLTAAILAGLSNLTIKQRQEHAQALMASLLSGVQAHLDCPLPPLRHLGMVASECFSQVLIESLNKPIEPLQFDYPSDSDTEMLWAVAGLKRANEKDPSPESEDDSALDKEATNVNSNGTPLDGETTQDDPIPYILPNEKRETEYNPNPIRAPAYLRDCLKLLRANKDRDSSEGIIKALEAIPGLLDSQSGRSIVDEVAVDLVQAVLLTEEPPFYSNYLQVRHQDMVALCVACPKSVATFLTNQFYASNYTLSQRLDMLDVLASAAQSLADDKSNKGFLPKNKRKIVEYIGSEQENITHLKALNIRANDNSSSDSDNDNEDDRRRREPGNKARSLVERRVEANTKRRYSAPIGASNPNQLGPVVGYFFYGLMKGFDSKEAEPIMSFGDGVVLAHLVHVLGIVVAAAPLTPDTPYMIQTLCSFLLAIRYHPAIGVRRAVILSLAKAIRSVPPSLLTQWLGSDLKEWAQWLRDAMDSDPDGQIRELAITVVMVLDELLAIPSTN